MGQFEVELYCFYLRLLLQSQKVTKERVKDLSVIWNNQVCKLLNHQYSKLILCGIKTLAQIISKVIMFYFYFIL
jgi:hypothetical protein